MILRRTIRLLAVAALATACSGCELIIDLFTGQHATKTVSGTVTVNGEPYYPAVLYVSSRDSTFTDQRGVYSLLIEQYVDRALDIADRAMVLRWGELAWSGSAGEARQQAAEQYLGQEAAAGA